jgi:hypothetical protein
MAKLFGNVSQVPGSLGERLRESEIAGKCQSADGLRGYERQVSWSSVGGWLGGERWQTGGVVRAVGWMREETNIWQQQMIIARTRTRERHWEELFPSNWRAWLRSGVSGYWRQGPQCARGRRQRGERVRESG